MFARENWPIADSITPDYPCKLFIEALEDLEVMVKEKVNLKNCSIGARGIDSRHHIIS